jgi:hypothetical protein
MGKRVAFGSPLRPTPWSTARQRKDPGMRRLALGLVASLAVLGGTAAAASTSAQVTIAASSPSIAKSGAVTLLGVVDTGQPFTCPPGALCPAPVPPNVMVLARRDRAHRFGRIAVVHSEAMSGDGSRFSWQLTVSPRRSTTYVAVSAGARSRPLRVRVVR